MDVEEPIVDEGQFRRCLRQACSAKNSLSRVKGSTPEQALLGKARALPGSLVSDEQLASHSLADSETPEGVRHCQDLTRREQARRAFISADNDSAYRRALLRQSRAVRDRYDMGDWVLYWKQGLGNKRVERGRWHGPAQVIATEGVKVLWLSHCGRLIRASPEHVRPASLREYPMLPRDSEGRVRNEEMDRRGPRSFIQLDEAPEYSPSVAPANEVVNAPPEQPENEISPQPSERSTLDLEPERERGMTEDLEMPDASNIPVPAEGEDDDLLCEDFIMNTEREMPIYEIEITGGPSMNVDQIETDENGITDEQAFLTTNGKRERVEVKLSDLNAEDRLLFEKAKAKEIQAWVDHQTVKRVAAGTLDSHQIMRSRWILVWKPPEHKGGQRRAKARLVILGFEDPNISTVPNDAPTITKDGKMLVLQAVSSHGWGLINFDISTAFLRGEGNNRKLGIHPPKELAQALKIQGQDQCLLQGGAYGRIDAPYLWYNSLRKTLESLGFVASIFDGCVFKG